MDWAEDFYSFAAGERFDVFCYWNGFGLGTDADQRRLTWWEQDRPEQRHTQTGRCYTPADFRLLRKSHEWTAVLTA